VAEGEGSVRPFNYTCTLPDGSTSTSRAVAYYLLADGKIVINDVMFVPDLMQVLGPYIAPTAGPDDLNTEGPSAR
jgi:hypothetical protein